MKWTEKQQQVIDTRNRNLLVSAAAGSGKTAVLVERIIQMISGGEHPLDLDQLLVMTFTNAAAAEMRERIAAAIEKKLMEQPENRHLQVQAALVPHAQITTIDSICLNLIGTGKRIPHGQAAPEDGRAGLGESVSGHSICV